MSPTPLYESCGLFGKHGPKVETCSPGDEAYDCSGVGGWFGRGTKVACDTTTDYQMDALQKDVDGVYDLVSSDVQTLNHQVKQLRNGLSEVKDGLSKYVTDSALTTKLAETDAALTTKLADYATDAALTTKLADYVTDSTLTTKLAETDSTLTTKLAETDAALTTKLRECPKILNGFRLRLDSSKPAVVCAYPHSASCKYIRCLFFLHLKCHIRIKAPPYQAKENKAPTLLRQRGGDPTHAQAK